MDITFQPHPAELERSVATFPAEWRSLLTRLRGAVPERLASTVRFVLNPNWNPLFTPNLPRSAADCLAYNALVRDFDFIAPSFYGRWVDVLAAPDGIVGVDGRWAEVRSPLTREHPDLRDRTKCRVGEYRGARMAIGEFGIGGNIRAIESGVPITKPVVASRRELIRRLLEWASARPSSAVDTSMAPLPMNIWTVATFDPVGIAKSSRTIPWGDDGRC